MKHIQLAEGLVKVVRGDHIQLGIATDIPSRTLHFSRLEHIRHYGGWIVRDNRLFAWEPEGFVEHEGHILLCGAYIEGVTLAELLQTRMALPYLSRLSRALATLRAHNKHISGLHTRAILFLKDGGVLLLSPELVALLRNYQPAEERILMYDHFNHPDLESEHNISFALAALAYRVLTGEVPFATAESSELRARMRASLFPSVHFYSPEATAEVATIVRTSLAKPTTNFRTPDEWSNLFQSWLLTGTHTDLNEQEHASIAASSEAALRRSEQSFQRRQFLRTNWRRIALILVLVATISSIPIAILRGALRPRSIAGLPASEVVRTFYTSINRLDHVTMQDCVTDGAGSDEIDEVTRLFVISRARLAVERQSPLVDPLIWRNEGTPSLPPTSALYGIEQLVISIERQREELATIGVRYYKWVPDFSEPEVTPIGATNSVVLERHDRLRLRLKGTTWLIYEIERLYEEPLSSL